LPGVVRFSSVRSKYRSSEPEDSSRSGIITGFKTEPSRQNKFLIGWKFQQDNTAVPSFFLSFLFSPFPVLFLKTELELVFNCLCLSFRKEINNKRNKNRHNCRPSF
jgi:hypothetical protein